ncbi:TPA: phage minor tail protein L [Enterobacter hormaechei]|uniref:phage minor tail protein L n=1 Tax=Enterobacter hormaechei TaxID=158836 RepID=UPI0027D29564|nr:phage minor tail protein L [Enterobacter hormaechei]WLZ51344.1 phage minor tail protein L [Enterobacter hormaechei]HCM9524685.1 phage minor tail protein L [Enterobacter hormaechei subsp. xiangfangensis]
MSISSDVQKLEPGKRVRLIEVDGSAFGAGILRFHNETIPHTEAEIIAAGGDESKLEPKSVWWQGQEYGAWPYELTGISVSSDGQSSRPSLTVANISGTIGALCRRFQGMAKAKVIIHDTFAHYLDARNFPGGNPTANPNEERKQVYYIDRKSGSDDETVEFELSSPADLRGQLIPTRQIQPMCTWCMRGWYKTGNGCTYAGKNGWFDKDGNRVDDPSQDVCSGLLSTGCKPRFGENEQLDYGGFPGASLLRG